MSRTISVNTHNGIFVLWTGTLASSFMPAITFIEMGIVFLTLHVTRTIKTFLPTSRQPPLLVYLKGEIKFNKLNYRNIDMYHFQVQAKKNINIPAIPSKKR